MGDFHVDGLLTNISIAFRNEAYFADRIFPIVEVTKQSDDFASYNQDYWFRDDAGRGTPGGLPTYVGYEVGTCDYNCVQWQAAKLIPDAIRANADEPFQLDTEATNFVTDKIQLRRERSMVADFLTVGIWGTTACGVAASGTESSTAFFRWNEYAESAPAVNVRQGISTIQAATGKTPNKLVLGGEVFNDILNHPDFIDRIKASQLGVVTEQLLAQIFGVAEVIVCKSIYATNVEGQTGAYAFNFANDALLLYTPATPGLLEPSAGYTFVWNGGMAGAQRGQVIGRWRHVERKSDVVEAQTWYDQKSVATALGYYWHDATN
jgi:hypothetical protein